MIGTNRPSHQSFPGSVARLLLLAAAACGGGGGGGSSDASPTVIAATFAGVTTTPAAGDTLLLTFSEDIELVGGNLLTDADVTLSNGATLGTVTAGPSQLTARTISIQLGNGVSFTPGATTIALLTTNDVIRDLGGNLGSGGTPVTIGISDGVAPVLSHVTISAVDDELNGTGSAGGTLQVPPNGWSIDLLFSDVGGVDATRTVVTANVAVQAGGGTRLAGTDLAPYLTLLDASATAARYRVPNTVVFPTTPFTLSVTAVDLSGLSSTPRSFSATCRTFTDALRPFETGTNPQQVWYLDFSRDVESYTTSSVTGGVAVAVVPGANGRSDFEDLLRIVGLNATDDTVNATVVDRFQTAMLTNLQDFYSGVNVTFTRTQPSGTFNGNSSVAYNSLGFSRISIAGAASGSGVLGVAIFDPNNATQNDDTLTNFSGTRLGIFLHTIVDAGMGPPQSSAFRQTFNPLAAALGGTPVGADGQDAQRLAGSLTDGRRDAIDAAIADLARFAATVTAHECGHSMGLVVNGAMPVGLYGNDPTNFPGSVDGHIRNLSLFPAGSTNIMSPSLSYSAAINAATAFNTLNLAYLREQVFYGN